MAAIDLTTYSGLQDAVGQYLNRRDLTPQIPAFIAQAEAKFNRELRVRDMQTIADGLFTSARSPIPDDFLAMHTLTIKEHSAWGEPLEFVSEERARDIRATHFQHGRVRYFTIFGSNFELIDAPTSSTPIPLRLRYYAKIPPLASNTSNWLLGKSPDLYLHSSLLEAAVFLKNDDRLGMWGSLRQQMMDAMVLEDQRARFPQGALNAQRKTFG